MGLCFKLRYVNGTYLGQHQEPQKPGSPKSHSTQGVYKKGIVYGV